MSLFIPGMKCSLCGHSIGKDDQTIAFGSFVPNEMDPLWIFNDKTFHASCFYSHPLSVKASVRYEEFRENMFSNKKICSICNDEISDPDDYFGFFYLTDKIGHPLYRYNYTHLHRSCMNSWPELPQIYNLLEEFRNSGEWVGKALDVLMVEVKNILSSTGQQK